MGRLFQDKKGREWEEKYNKDTCKREGEGKMDLGHMKAMENSSKKETEYKPGKWSE